MQKSLSQKRWVNALLRVEHVLCEIIDRLCAVILMAMLAAMICQAVCRFILNISVPWTDELARYLFITLAYVGAGSAISGNTHIEISVITSFFRRIKKKGTKHRAAQTDDIIRYALLLLISILLLRLAWPYMWQVKAIAELSPALHLPKWIINGVLVFGLGSMALHSVLRILISIGDHDAIIDPMIVEEGETK